MMKTNYFRLIKILSTGKYMTFEQIETAWHERYPGIPFSHSTARQYISNLKKEGLLTRRSVVFFKAPVYAEDVIPEEAQKYV